MSRVFWDSMLFIYLVEADPQYGLPVLSLLQRCARRGDQLFTSHLSVAETLVGLPQDGGKERVLHDVLQDIEFTFAEFNGACIQPFPRLRRDFGLGQADALNLACASAVGADMFLTNDSELLRKKLVVLGFTSLRTVRARRSNSAHAHMSQRPCARRTEIEVKR